MTFCIRLIVQSRKRESKKYICEMLTFAKCLSVAMVPSKKIYSTRPSVSRTGVKLSEATESGIGIKTRPKKAKDHFWHKN